MLPTYTIEDLIGAVATSSNISEVMRKIGLRKGGGSRTLIQQKIATLGLDTTHLRYRPSGRKRAKSFFVCKQCGAEVVLRKYERTKTYCSETCLQFGRPQTIRDVLCDPKIRARLRTVAKTSWTSNREARIAALEVPTVKELRLRATRAACAQPELRAKRSQNAKERWKDDVFRERFQTASIIARRTRAKQETSPFKPHVAVHSRRHGALMVRSLWERDFVLWLDRENLLWSYEPTRIMCVDTHYTPDFWVLTPFGEAYIELHRMIHTVPGDSKLARLEAAQKETKLLILLLGETTMAAIRKQLRTSYD